MKSEERHELETNALAKFLVTAGEKIGPYSSHLIYGLLAIVVIWGVVRLSSSSFSAKDEQAWEAYAVATMRTQPDFERLEQTAEQYEGKTVGLLARMAWADGQLTQGCRNFFTNKDQAIESLNAAQEAYEKVAASAADDSLRDRARLGIARALEAKGQVAAAIEAYQRVSGPFRNLAEVRIEQLQELNAQQYADWLATAEGARRASDLGSGPRPDFAPDALGLPPGSGQPTGSEAAAEEDFLEMLRRFEERAPTAPSGDGRYEDAPADSDAATDAEGAAAGPDLFADPPSDADQGEADAAMERTEAEAPSSDDPASGDQPQPSDQPEDQPSDEESP